VPWGPTHPRCAPCAVTRVAYPRRPPTPHSALAAAALLHLALSPVARSLLPPVMRAACPAEPRLVLVVLMMVVLACRCLPLALTPMPGIDRPWSSLCCKTHVLSVSDVSEKCFRCFIWMLQW
jgi:hypothetical protein